MKSRIVRESTPRPCDGCGKNRLVLLYALGSKTWRACADCTLWLNEARGSLYANNLDSVEAT